MKCPLSYNKTVVIGGIECRQPAMDCRPDCACLVESGTVGGTYCAVAVIASSATDSMGFGPVNLMEDTKGGE